MIATQTGIIYIYVYIYIYINIQSHFQTIIDMTISMSIIIIIKRGWQCKAGRERLTPYQSEDPNPTTPTHRKKEEKGKTVVGVKK